MKSRLMLLTAIVFSSLYTMAATAQVYDVIVVAGQSNAEGVGLGTTVDDTSRDSLIFQLGRLGSDNLKVVPAKDPLQSWSYPNNFVSFGMSFAREYAKSLAAGHKVLIIPVAYGGSSILVWERSQILYQDMKTRIDTVLRNYPQSKIAAFLWHQGETDMIFLESKNPLMPSAEVYGMNLQVLVNNLRADFPSAPLFPILTGEPVPSWFKKNKSRCKIMKQIKSVVGQNREMYFTTSSGLNSNLEDNATTDQNQAIHFSARAQTQYGKRYFQTFQQKRSSSSDDSCF